MMSSALISELNFERVRVDTGASLHKSAQREAQNPASQHREVEVVDASVTV